MSPYRETEFKEFTETEAERMKRLAHIPAKVISERIQSKKDKKKEKEARRDIKVKARIKKRIPKILKQIEKHARKGKWEISIDRLTLFSERKWTWFLVNELEQHGFTSHYKNKYDYLIGWE